MKTKEQIEAFLEKFNSGANNFSGMTYEQGVEEALLWVLGKIEDEEFEF